MVRADSPVSDHLTQKQNPGSRRSSASLPFERAVWFSFAMDCFFRCGWTATRQLG